MRNMPTKSKRSQFVVITPTGTIEGPFSTRIAAVNYLNKLAAYFGPDATREVQISVLFPPYRFSDKKYKPHGRS